MRKLGLGVRVEECCKWQSLELYGDGATEL